MNRATDTARTRFERMVQWAEREDPSLTRAQAEANTLACTARMPAWARHPRVHAAQRTGRA